jgi:hypothetical protein
MVGIEFGRPQPQIVFIDFAVQPSLRERRPLIGKLGFFANERDRVLPAEFPQQGHGRPAGVSATNNNYVRCVWSHINLPHANVARCSLERSDPRDMHQDRLQKVGSAQRSFRPRER